MRRNNFFHHRVNKESERRTAFFFVDDFDAECVVIGAQKSFTSQRDLWIRDAIDIHAPEISGTVLLIIAHGSSALPARDAKKAGVSTARLSESIVFEHSRIIERDVVGWP